MNDAYLIRTLTMLGPIRAPMMMDCYEFIIRILMNDAYLIRTPTMLGPIHVPMIDGYV